MSGKPDNEISQMQDALSPAIEALDDIPERTKLSHLWRFYTGLGLVVIVGLFAIATYALRYALLDTIRDEINPSIESVRTNLATFLPAELYHKDQDTKERQRIEREELRQRIADLEKNQLQSRVATLEGIAKENRSLIETHYKEMSGSLHRIELGVANIRQNTREKSAAN